MRESKETHTRKRNFTQLQYAKQSHTKGSEDRLIFAWELCSLKTAFRSLELGADFIEKIIY